VLAAPEDVFCILPRERWTPTCTFRSNCFFYGGKLLRKDVRSQKKQIVAANLELSDAEAVKFWPVYDRYTADLSKIYDTKLALVEEYMDHYTTMTGEQAENYIRRRAAVEQDVMQLRLKYVPEFRRVLSGRETALFFQIEWRLDLMVNLQLAQAPLIDP
jgi:hypothetical protein